MFKYTWYITDMTHVVMDSCYRGGLEGESIFFFFLSPFPVMGMAARARFHACVSETLGF